MRAEIGGHARHRRPEHRALRSVSKLDLLKPRTSETRIAEMHADIRARAKNRPAVYRMVAADGEVVYVGKSKQLRSRLLSYFRGAYPDEKGARILREAHTIE